MKWTKGAVLLIALALIFSLAACGAEKTELETEAAAEYRILVLTEEGTPVEGAMVQLCTDICIPGITDEKGEAIFSVPEDSYKVSFAVLPQGYAYADDVREYYFAAGSTELTLYLKEAA